MEILFIFAVLPVAFLLFYIYKKDTNKEPFFLLAKIFGLGVLTIIPAVILELIVGIFLPTENVSPIFLFISVFVGVALIEEAVKWAVVKKITFYNYEFDEAYDAIVYAVYSSLGFACFENVLYVLQNGLTNAIFRAITAVPGHCCFGVIMGYFIAKAKYFEIKQDQKEYKKNMTYSLLLPILAHTIYDYFLMVDFDLLGLGLWIISYIAILIISVNLINKLSKNNFNFYNESNVIEEIPKTPNNLQQAAQNIDFYPSTPNKFCSKCGSPVSEEAAFCTKCGNPLV